MKVRVKLQRWNAYGSGPAKTVWYGQDDDGGIVMFSDLAPLLAIVEAAVKEADFHETAFRQAADDFDPGECDCAICASVRSAREKGVL